ncbi:HNH endonuclease [Pinibacter soli]|uniref:NUMOD4 domain-containing protein n=1 Tax=Pinibacter soli TaxID=3044211 RepID=A0ABT6RFM9_9BACT|nr:HNH endonuclease [Pinibacter soli]MDI3321382.1 NUMOD4 domain-containing protein [Pinibacter soli]
MIKLLPGEEWKSLQFTGWKLLRRKYALSSHGRIASYTNKLEEDGRVLGGSLTTGYKTLNLHRLESNGTLYVHRELATLFIKKPSPKHKYVIHINHNKTDNSINNLAWATLDEMMAHQQMSPAKLAYKKVQANRTKGSKLNATQVRRIKTILASRDRKLTIKQLAGKYGVTEMTLYRIKSGENWAHI